MKLDAKKTAVLTLDLQAGILGMAKGTESILPAAARAVNWARENRALLIHVGLGFSEGHPEIPANSRFAQVKENKLFLKGSPSAEFDPSIFRSEDLIVYKQRVSGFSENSLHMILRAHGIENLILMGIATSGIVLSTVRQASDLDFKLVVLKDACFDADEEVHRVLTEKVFPRQADVLTVDQWIQNQN